MICARRPFDSKFRHSFIAAAVAARMLFGSIALAAPESNHPLLIPDGLLAPAVSPSSGLELKPAQFAAFSTDEKGSAVDISKPVNSEMYDCRPSCDCECNSNDWCAGIVKPSDRCFDSFISPITNPVYFEDPRNVSEARFIFLNHKVPNPAGGGDVQLYALQIRAALSDRLSLIATKDGFIVSQNPAIDDGWGDVSAGLKYLLYADPYDQILVSTGVVYEMPVGSTRSQQANGDGTFDLFMTGGAQLCRNGHWISAGGFVLPTDDNENSTWCYASNHFDYEFRRGWYALMEYNWYHWLESGDGGLPGVEGNDLFNFGSRDVAGNDIVSGAFGVKYKPSRQTEIGVAWELPLTERRDVLENRLAFDYIVRF